MSCYFISYFFSSYLCESLHSPISHNIFVFPLAESFTFWPDFVTVTRQDLVQWDVLQEPLAVLIQEHFANYSEASAVEENPQPPVEKRTDSLQSPEAQVIQQLFEEEVNPSLASHGGFVTLKAVESNTVYLEMGGGCQGCAMSYMTLKEGIETAIKSRVPSIQNVVDVTDHSSGTNPYM